MLSEKTKLVTCTHTSNILGTISDIKSIAATVHSIPGALLCVDAVAYAPHRAIVEYADAVRSTHQRTLASGETARSSKFIIEW